MGLARCFSTTCLVKGTRSEKKRDYVGKFPRRLRRLYGKIAEVIWAFGLKFFHITSAIFPYNLHNLLGNFSHIIPGFFYRVPKDLHLNCGGAVNKKHREFVSGLRLSGRSVSLVDVKPPIWRFSEQ